VIAPKTPLPAVKEALIGPPVRLLKDIFAVVFVTGKYQKASAFVFTEPLIIAPPFNPYGSLLKSSKVGIVILI
jgi:hypothetical protein